MPPRLLYDLGCRLGRMPWEIGPRPELVDLVGRGQLMPCRAIDLGCGTWANAIFLAGRGFEVTGVDFAPAALARAEAAAARAGVGVRFVADDLTAPRHDLGTFELLVDYGTLDDLSPGQRDRYLHTVARLAAPAARFLLWCFEWVPRRFDRVVGMRAMAPGEVERRFGATFHVERIAGARATGRWRLVAGYAAYLMTRSPVREAP